MANPSGETSVASACRLEVRIGTARPTLYEVGDGGFLIGSVPGCDLRLGGTNLPPVLCLIARQPGGASVRRLAPVQPVAVNGKNVPGAYLRDGDQITLGNVEILVSIEAASPAQPLPPPDYQDRLRQLAQREEYLRQREAELEQRAAAPAAPASSAGELDARAEELSRQENEVAALRAELGRIRTELVGRYQERREELERQEEAIREAGRLVQMRKEEVDEEEVRLRAAKEQWVQRQAEIEARGEQVERERQLVEEQHRLVASRQQEQQRDVAGRVDALTRREQALNDEKAALERGQKQHQADLVRLDRLQGTVETRQRQLQQRAMEIDHRFEQLQRDTRDLEEQAAQLDEWHTRLTGEAEKMVARGKELEASAAQFDQRASALEGQQTMLVTLRTRMEKMRDDLRSQEQAIADQRVALEAREEDIRRQADEAGRMRAELHNDRQLFDEERRRFDERRGTLEQAVAQLRQAREAIEQEQTQLRLRQEQFDAIAAQQEQEAETLLIRGQQLNDTTTKIDTDRASLQEREAAVARAEKTLAALQEQVRKRAEEIGERQRQLDERDRLLQSVATEQQARLELAEQMQGKAAVELDQRQGQCDERAAELDALSRELGEREQALAAERQAIDEAQQTLTAQRQTLAADRVGWEVEKRAESERQGQARTEVEQQREQLMALLRQLPDLELRAGAALERLARAREQLHEHLGEVHAYARQSREELAAARQAVQQEREQLQQREQQLQAARDEHRAASASFRGQVIEWQGQIGEMRQALQLGSSRLEMRQAEVDEKARQLADTQSRLAAEVERIETERAEVVEKRNAMDRHLGDMKEWYRRKFRELSGVDVPPGEPGEGDIVPMPLMASPASVEPGERDPSHAVLSLRDELAPADRHLGELLETHGLVDSEVLHGLWAEARRQRRSLRQLLLADNILTLYQMSLIEADNLDGLMLGPVRVIDKLQAATPREAVYRVDDPRREGQAMLRHLAESEMDDAVRPDEFEQRFLVATAVKDENVAAVLEVLHIAGRPAALVEWVQGVSSADWPGLAAAPAAWFRLILQAALALHAVHREGLCHGHIDASSFVLMPDGTLKLVGLGEPRWLAASSGDESVAGDLTALGRVAAEWAALPPSGKSKSKPLPEELRAVLARLVSEGEDRFASAFDLIEELRNAGAKVPGATTAWTRLLEKVREQVPASRRSA